MCGNGLANAKGGELIVVKFDRQKLNCWSNFTRGSVVTEQTIRLAFPCIWPSSECVSECTSGCDHRGPKTLRGGSGMAKSETSGAACAKLADGSPAAPCRLIIERCFVPRIREPPPRRLFSLEGPTSLGRPAQGHAVVRAGESSPRPKQQHLVPLRQQRCLGWSTRQVAGPHVVTSVLGARM